MTTTLQIDQALQIDKLTVDQFLSFLATRSKSEYYELRDGEIVEMTFPKMRHTWTQHRLQKLMVDVLDPRTWWVQPECPYQANPFDLRRADVAAVRLERVKQADIEECLQGSPEWVAEVLSPSNSRLQILNTRDLCLANGCQEFWAVDPKGKRVTVYRLNSDGKVYKPGDMIPLAIEPGRSISAAEIFE